MSVECCDLNYCVADDIISYASTVCKAYLASRIITLFNQVSLNYKEENAEQLFLLSF